MSHLPPLMTTEMFSLNMRRAVWLGLLFLSAVSSVHSEQSLKQKMTPPADLSQLTNLRIWAPAERDSACRLVVHILDSSGQVIRHLVDYISPPGPYNFYWNKRNDSGALVEPGFYRYEVDNCGIKKEGKLKAEFKMWEKLSRLEIDNDTCGFRLALLADSAAVSVEWFNFGKRMAGRYYLHEAMMKGEYHFHWRDTMDEKSIKLIPQLMPGFYIQKVIVGDFIYSDTIRFFNQ